MTKVAYCVSGEMRGLDVWQTHEQQIIQPLIADKFVHTWKRTDTSSSDAPFIQRGGERHLVYSNEVAISCINPKSYIIEDKNGIVVDPCEDIQRPPEYSDVVPRDRCFYMWRGWNRAFACMEMYGNYDVVIRSRSDIVFGTQYIPFNLSSIDNNTIYIPQGNDGGDLSNGLSLCDWFAFGKKEEMRKYCMIYYMVGKYMKLGIPLHPEIMLYTHLRNMGLTVVRFPLQYRLHRTF